MSSLPAADAATPYGTLPLASPPSTRKPLSVPRLADIHARGEKIVMLTAYDATLAAVADAAGVECLLVGDSLGMVCQGPPSTVGVSLDTMRYHTDGVARGLRRTQGTAWLIADLPFGSYHESQEQALRSACELPGLTVPTGVVAGLPTAVQVVADWFSEDLCFGVGEIIEAAVSMPTPINPRSARSA
jgi:3-methyl-2-oxobutanoate hydroxymethyltransferase